MEELLKLFQYYFGGDYEKPRSKPPSPRTNRHIGTKELPYRVSHSDKQRRRAIEAGIEELAQDPSVGDDKAVEAKRKRLILIRTLHRHTPSCHTLDSDVKWLYTHYKLDPSHLKFECSPRR